MSNEIYHNFPSGNTLYAIIHKKTDDTVNLQGTNNFEAWVDGNIGTYDHPMTDNDGDYYSVDFPTSITGTDLAVYRTSVFKQLGGAPAAGTDIVLAQGEIFWDGTQEIDIGTINITNQTVTNVYEESTPPPITVINETLNV